MTKLDRNEAVGWVRAVAASRLDTFLDQHGGFTRRRPAELAYGRAVADGKQAIHLLLSAAFYAPGSWKLVMRVTTAFPDLARTASAMLDPASSQFGKGGIVDIAFHEMLGQGPDILFSSEPGLNDIVPAVENRLTRHLIPYLDGRDSIAKLTAQKWAGWSNAAASGHSVSESPVVVAAGHIVAGAWDAAAYALEVGYPAGSVGRVHYRGAFAYVQGRGQDSRTSP